MLSHTTIPLCSFRYVRDTLSSVSFNYINEGISKTETKSINKDKVTEIDKFQDIYIYNEDQVINKDYGKELSSYSTHIQINTSHIVERDTIILDKRKCKGLISSEVRQMFIGDSITLSNNYYPSIGKSRGIYVYKSLSNIDKKTKIYNLYKNKYAPISKDFKNKYICDLENDISQYINYSLETNNHELSKYYYKLINRPDNLGIQKNEINSLIKDEISISLDDRKSLYINPKEISKSLTEYQLEAESLINLVKCVTRTPLYREHLIDLLRNKEGYLSREIAHSLGKSDKPLSLNSEIITGIIKDNSQRYSAREYIASIIKDGTKKYFHREARYPLIKNPNVKHFYRELLIPMIKDKNKKYFYREDLIPIFDLSHKNYLSKEILISVFKNKENYLGKQVIIPVYKNPESYLSHMTTINIYKELEKYLSKLKVKMIDLYGEESRYLCSNIVNGIYKENTKFINVTKRWWWLSDTHPKDKLIVPNKDYSKMGDLLNNDNFEYLRYSNHPIEWGKSWGTDWSIPTYDVSVEIMLDLVNIIIMIWHKNNQGWFNVTGKEAMQLLLELLYDWYSMPTSTPSTSYYRAYRWIRWEAEKVYFLSTKNGLQAIGILVANLIDYLKYHHFNVVPIWKKPGAMDEGRNFNKIATNGDLMQEVDKIKGNRHYLIESQNFEKINIFRR